MNRRHFLASLGGTIAASAAAGTASASQFEELRRLRLERDGEARLRRDDSEPRRTRHEPARQRGESGFAAPAGADLQAVLAAWSRQAGWTLVWQSAYAYELTSGGRFAGTFEDSVRALLLAMRHTRPNPTAVFYGGNRVLVISNQSQTATD